MRNNIDVYRNNNRHVSPFRFFDSNLFDDLVNFNDLFYDKSLAPRSHYPLACDSYETQNAYVYKMDIPGVKKEDINLSLNKDVLEVTAKRSQEDSWESKDGVKSVERFYGSFYRALPLPQNITQKVEASYKDGVLTLEVEKDKKAETVKKIEIKG